MTEVSPMPEAKPKSPSPGNFEEYEGLPNSVPESSVVEAKVSLEMANENQTANLCPPSLKELNYTNSSANQKDFKSPEVVITGDNSERRLSASGHTTNLPRGTENKGREFHSNTGPLTVNNPKQLDNSKLKSDNQDTAHEKANADAIRPIPDRYNAFFDNSKQSNPNLSGESQRFAPDASSSNSMQNLSQNAASKSYRSGALDGSFPKTASVSSALSAQHSAPGGAQPSPIATNQVLNKPESTSAGYQPSFTNPTRQSSSYQMTSVPGYSTSFQPSPPSQTFPSAQLREMPRSSNISFQNPSIQTLSNSGFNAQSQMQRGYTAAQTIGDLSSQQNRSLNPTASRPQFTQPIYNRPPLYQTYSSQRIMPDSYQKSPNIQPIRPGYISGQNTSPANPIPSSQQFFNPISRNATLSTGIQPNTVTASNFNESGLRLLKNDTNMDDVTSKLRMQISSVGLTASDSKSTYSTSPSIVDQNKSIRLTTITESTGSYGKKESENEEEKTEDLKGNMEKVETENNRKDDGDLKITKIEGDGNIKLKNFESKEKDDGSESGIVIANIKFFEERDTARIPLTPQKTSPVKRTSTPRLIAPGNLVKGKWHWEEEYESGVDETPLFFPNLRRVDPWDKDAGRGNLFKHKKGPATKSKYGNVETNSSYPGTPVRLNPVLKSGPRSAGLSRVPSKSHKSILEFTPEEELLYFFSIAKSACPRKFDRNSDASRIEDVTVKKKSSLENMPTANGDVHAVKKTPTRLPAPSKRSSSASSPTKTPLKSPGVPKSLPKTPESPLPTTPLIKKVPMNKIQVGAAPSPNIKAVKSKIGSLANTTHKPGGGNIKIESHKVDFSKAQPRIAAKNDNYAPGGGDKKIQQVKLQWSAKPKVGSLDNATHKPGGGDKKIESIKLDFKDKAKPKVGSKENVKHVPGGGAVKIESQKLEFKAQSKVGSLDNVKHKPGGGDIKIFDDKTYLKQISCGSSEGRASETQSYCDLSVVSEVQSISAPDTPHHGTSIKIKKSTTLARTRPEIRKTTEVTVMSRSESKERKGLIRSPSTQEVKLTYSKVASPKHRKTEINNVGPVEVIKIPVNENAPILNPIVDHQDNIPLEVKNLISSFEQQISHTTGSLSGHNGKNFQKTKLEPSQEKRFLNELNEELNQKFIPVKEELDRRVQNQSQKLEESLKRDEEAMDVNEKEPTMSKFLRNEIAAHEKVGELWREVHNIEPDKWSIQKSEENLPPPPFSTSAAQKLGIQQQQQQSPSANQHSIGVRPQTLKSGYPQQNPPSQRPPNQFPQQQQLLINPGMQKPPLMQSNQRLQNQISSQSKPVPANPTGERSPFPIEPSPGKVTLQERPGIMLQRNLQNIPEDPFHAKPVSSSIANQPTFSSKDHMNN